MMLDSGANSELSLTLTKGLNVLQYAAGKPFGCTISEVATDLKISRAAARRMLLTLAHAGYLHQHKTWFLPTLGLASLAACPILEDSFWRQILPPMREVSSKTGESCSVSVLDASDIAYVARSPSRRVLSVHLEVGSRLPASHTSMGRVLLSSLSTADLQVRLSEGQLRRRTRHSLVTMNQLLDELSRIEAQGYSIVDQELEEDLISAAVPIFGPTGAVFAALNFSSTPKRYPSKRLRETVVPLLEDASIQITEILFASQKDMKTPGKDSGK